MVALEVPTGPKHLARLGVQTRSGRGTECHVNPALLDYRRWGGVGVVFANVRLFLEREQLEIMQDLPGVAVHAQDEKLQAILGGGGLPDLIAPNYGGGPRFSVDWHLPLNVIGFTPRQRQPAGLGGTIPPGSTKLSPILPDCAPGESGDT